MKPIFASGRRCCRDRHVNADVSNHKLAVVLTVELGGDLDDNPGFEPSFSLPRWVDASWSKPS